MYYHLALVALCAPLFALAQEPKAKPDAPVPGAVARLGQSRLRHAQPPTCAVFDSSGKVFYTGGEDGTLRAWSVETGAQLALVEHAGRTVHGLRLTAGGKQLVADYGDVLRVYELPALRELRTLPYANRTRYAVSADGKYVCTANALGAAVVEETATGLQQLALEDAHALDFRPDGRALAVGGAKGALAVYNVVGGKPILRANHDGPITGVAFSPNGKRLAVATRANGEAVVRVYEGTDPKPVAEVSGASTLSGWLSDSLLACGGPVGSGTFDLAKKQWAGRVKEATGAFAVSPDGTKLAALGTGLRVRLWDVPTGQQLHAKDDTFPEPALLAGTADGQNLFLLAGSGAYRWNVKAPNAEPAGALPGRAVVAATAAQTLLVATSDALLAYAAFDPAQPLPAKPAHTFADSANVRAVALTATGKRVAWATEAGKVFVANADGTQRREVPLGTSSAVFALGFNPAGDRLGVLGRDAHFRVWDVTAEQPKPVWKARVQRGQKGAVAFAPNGKTVAIASTSQVQVFDASDGSDPDEQRPPLFQFERYSDEGHVHHLAYTPDGRALVAGSTGHYGRVEVWDVATRGLIRAFSTGYGGTSRVCVYPNGARAASAGAEEAVTVWDLTFRDGKANPSVVDVQLAWVQLDSPKAEVAVPAVRALAAAGDRGTDVIARGAKEQVATAGRIKELIADLGSAQFSTREAASRDLLGLGVRALPAVTAATKSEDPEVRDRAADLLKKLNGRGQTVPAHGLAGDDLRMVRAVHALELIATPAARDLLKVIADAGGAPGAGAKAALARLKK